MSKARANINVEILKWAREKAGYSEEEAARKLQITPERYQAWENPKDDRKPTFNQLRRTAKLFKRPVSVLYLAKPPEGFDVIRDFRRLPGDGIKFYSPALLYEMELAQQRREIALELYEEFDAGLPEFTFNANLIEDPEELGIRIRKDLGISFREQIKWKTKDQLGPFKALRKAMENQGILVFQMNKVEVREVSGFAIAKEKLPIIAINRKEVPNRRTFGLAHEYVHLLLRISGASDLDVDATRPPEEQRVEVFCNQTAAAMLMPRHRVLGLSAVQSHGPLSEDWEEDEIREFSSLFGVSREAFLRRLLTFNRTTQNFYNFKRKQYNEDFLREREDRRKKLRESAQQFKKNPPRDVFVELGRPFVRLILDSSRADFITLNEASGYLGNLRIRHFPKLEESVYSR